MQAFIAAMGTTMVFLFALLVWAWTHSPITVAIAFTTAALCVGFVASFVCDELNRR